jgi:hypothetical protein
MKANMLSASLMVEFGRVVRAMQLVDLDLKSLHHMELDRHQQLLPHELGHLNVQSM